MPDVHRAELGTCRAMPALLPDLRILEKVRSAYPSWQLGERAVTRQRGHIRLRGYLFPPEHDQLGAPLPSLRAWFIYRS